MVKLNCFFWIFITDFGDVKVLYRVFCSPLYNSLKIKVKLNWFIKKINNISNSGWIEKKDENQCKINNETAVIIKYHIITPIGYSDVMIYNWILGHAIISSYVEWSEPSAHYSIIALCHFILVVSIFITLLSFYYY